MSFPYTFKLILKLDDLLSEDTATWTVKREGVKALLGLFQRLEKRTPTRVFAGV